MRVCVCVCVCVCVSACLTIGLPFLSRCTMSSALPWSAVTRKRAPTESATYVHTHTHTRTHTRTHELVHWFFSAQTHSQAPGRKVRRTHAPPACLALTFSSPKTPVVRTRARAGLCVCVCVHVCACVCSLPRAVLPGTCPQSPLPSSWPPGHLCDPPCQDWRS